jgi:hypothetical protein
MTVVSRSKDLDLQETEKQIENTRSRQTSNHSSRRLAFSSVQPNDLIIGRCSIVVNIRERESDNVQIPRATKKEILIPRGYGQLLNRLY